jgi:hypothetical protein
MTTPRTTRFIIVANGRTGSTLLVDLLDSHPMIACADELLNERHWRRRHRPLLWLARAFPILYLERQAHKSTQAAYGFKLKTGGQVHNLGSTLTSLHRRGWKLIYLARSDALQQTFSWSVAKLTGRWQTTIEQPGRSQSVTLDVPSFLRDLQTTLHDRQCLAEIMAPLPHLALVYEDDLARPVLRPATCERICTWLGIAPAPCSNRIVRTWEQPYPAMIRNYDEIVAAVADSPWYEQIKLPESYDTEANPHCHATHDE